MLPQPRRGPLERVLCRRRHLRIRVVPAQREAVRLVVVKMVGRGRFLFFVLRVEHLDDLSAEGIGNLLVVGGEEHEQRGLFHGLEVVQGQERRVQQGRGGHGGLWPSGEERGVQSAPAKTHDGDRQSAFRVRGRKPLRGLLDNRPRRWQDPLLRVPGKPAFKLVRAELLVGRPRVSAEKVGKDDGKVSSGSSREAVGPEFGVFAVRSKDIGDEEDDSFGKAVVGREGDVGVEAGEAVFVWLNCW